MRYLAAVFFVVAVIAGVLGFGGAADIGPMWANVARALCFLGFLMFVASLIVAAVVRRRPPRS